jgi:hypothetical protein
MPLWCGQGQICPYCSQTVGKVVGHYKAHGSTAPSGPCPPYCHSFTSALLWMSNQVIAETSTWQHTTLTRDRHPYLRRHSNSQSKQEGGSTPTSQSTQWFESAYYTRLWPITLDYDLLHVISELPFTSLPFISMLHNLRSRSFVDIYGFTNHSFSQ